MIIKTVLEKVKEVIEADSTLSYLNAVEISQNVNIDRFVSKSKYPFVLIRPENEERNATMISYQLENIYTINITVGTIGKDPIALLGDTATSQKGAIDLVNDILNALYNNKQLDNTVEIMYPDSNITYLYSERDDKRFLSGATFNVKYRYLGDFDPNY